MSSRAVPFELVLRELRGHNFAVLSTVGESGQPQSAGVNYGVTPPGQPLALYVMTRSHLAKARNIARNPRIALVVPITRKLLWFLPPATLQLHGRAEIVSWTDAEGRRVFRRFLMGRRILAAYAQARRQGETRVCFLRITPDPVIHTYMVGMSLWSIARDMESGAGESMIPG